MHISISVLLLLLMYLLLLLVLAAVLKVVAAALAVVVVGVFDRGNSLLRPAVLVLLVIHPLRPNCNMQHQTNCTGESGGVGRCCCSACCVCPCVSHHLLYQGAVRLHWLIAAMMQEVFVHIRYAPASCLLLLAALS